MALFEYRLKHTCTIDLRPNLVQLRTVELLANNDCGKESYCSWFGMYMACLMLDLSTAGCFFFLQWFTIIG